MCELKLGFLVKYVCSRYNTQAYVQQKNPEDCTITYEQVAMDFEKHHLKKVTLK